MRTVLKNLVYDSSKAHKIAEWNNGKDKGDPHYYREALHQKKTGEFFIHGSGGGLSPYGKATKFGWADGEAIKPTTPDGARQWMKSNRPDMYEHIFGTIQEPETGERTAIRLVLDSGLLKKAKRLAVKKGCNPQTLLENYIREDS